MINVLTWLWRQSKGRTRYTAEHVNIWAAMVGRNLSLPHRLYCVTNIPDGITEEVGIIDLPTVFNGVQSKAWPAQAGKPQCYCRIDMFRPDAAEIYGERIVSMDLDCVVTGRLDPLFDRGNDFIMLKSESPRRPYNGSMVMMDAGARARVYKKFRASRMEEVNKVFVGSDQAWISYALGWCEDVWTEQDGVYQWTHGFMKHSKNGKKPPDDMRLLFFPVPQKPWQLMDKYKWIREFYK